MTSFGALIPPGARRALMERRLKPGAIVLLDVQFPNGTRKPKFLMLAASEGDDYYFVINSNPAPFIQRKPELLACQVTIDQASHPFLHYDSHIDCTGLTRLPRAAVLDDLVDTPDRFKGTASPAVIEQLIAAVKRAPTLPVQQQMMVVRAFTS